MSPHRNELDLVAELEALRPAPDSEFTRELDARAAEGFPRRTPDGAPSRERRSDRLAGFRWSRAVAPAAAVAVAAVVIATAAVSLSERGAVQSLSVTDAPTTQPPAGGPVIERSASSGSTSAARAPTTDSGPIQSDVPASALGTQIAGRGQTASALRDREIERSAQIVLEADPSEVRAASSRVFGVVRDHDGIVLRSSVRDRREASVATFILQIPSRELDEALAAFSEIATVRSRSDSTADVTAPAVSLRARLRDSRARIDGLLSELSGADTTEARESVEREVRAERNRATFLRSRLAGLQRRVQFSSVSLRIVSGSAGIDGGAWGVDDAIDDASRILAVAAGVTLIGLAILAPIALLLLAAWAAHRTWTRRSRERALDRNPTPP